MGDIDFGPAATRRRLETGDTLVIEGGTDTDVFQIVAGTLDVERRTEHGAIVVASVGPGALVGEVTNAMGGKRTATLRATEPTEVAAFTQDEFAQWLLDHPVEAADIAAEARLRSNRSRASAVLANLFGLENQDVVDAIVNEIRWLTLAPGDVLFEQGAEADAAYLLLAGRLRVFAKNDLGERTLDIEIGRGEIVGEMGILEDAPRSASVQAIRETTLAMISREAFEAITAFYPALMVRVFLTIIDRLTHRSGADDRARVVSFASTQLTRSTEQFDPVIAAVEAFGSTLHLSSNNLGRYVRDVHGPGGQARVAEFLHESDVAHDYVLLEGDDDATDWTISAARQSDRFVLFCSAEPDHDEQRRIRDRLGLLGEVQRESAWLVRVHPASAMRPRRSARFLDDFGVAEVHNVRADDPRHLARIGRLATGNGRGIVLGGGGAKGFAHIGALRALREAGLDYDRVGGASMGAVIGAFAAKDASPEEMVDAAVAEFRKDLLDYTVPMVLLLKAEKMAAGVESQFGGWDITDLWIPFFCVTTDITASDLAVHRRGELARIIRATSAIPVALPPVPIDGHLHVDGGVLDNVPVAPMAADNSIGTVIAIDVSPPGGPAADEDYGLSVSGFDVLRQRFSKSKESPYPDIGTTLMSSMLIGSTKAKNTSTDSEVVDLYIDLDLAGVGLLKFENHAEVAHKGYVQTKPIIEAWLRDG